MWHGVHRNLWWALALLIFVLGVAPLFYGGGLFSWYPVVGCLLSATGIAWCIAWYFRVRPHHVRDILPVRFVLPAWLYIIPIGAGLLQLVPWSALVTKLSPFCASIWYVVPGAQMRLTLAPDETLRMILMTFSGMMICLFCAAFCRRKGGILAIVYGMIFAGLISAIWGLMDALIFSQPGAVFVGDANNGKEVVLHVCKGVFQNRNHFGFFINIAFFLLSAFVMFQDGGDGADHHHHHELEAQDGWKVPTRMICGGLGLFLTLVAIFASLSRGAATGLLAGCICIAVLWAFNKRHHGHHRRLNYLACSIVLLGGFLFALPGLLGRLFERFDILFSDSVSEDARQEVWRTTLELISDNWLCGVGLGGFADAVQRLKSVTMTTVMIGHAHNDWLELASEIGLPAVTVMVILLVYFIVHCLLALFRQEDSRRFWAGTAALAALVACAVHECFDFNLHAGPNLMAFSAMLGILAGCCDTHHHHHTADEHPAPPRRFTWRLPVVFLALVGYFAYNAYAIPGQIYNDIFWTKTQPDYAPRGLGKPSIASLVKLGEATHKWLPSDASVNLRLGQVFYRGALELHDITPLKRRALLNQAATRLNEARLRAPAHSEIIVWQAITTEALGLRQSALDYCRQLIASAPTILQYNKFYAAACMREYLRHPSNTLRIETLEAYSNWIKIAPDELMTQLWNLTRLCISADELTRYCPSTPSIMPVIFSTLLRQGHYRDAEELLERFVTENDLVNNPELQLEHVNCQILLARLDDKPKKAERQERLWGEWRAAIDKLHHAVCDEVLSQYDGNEVLIPTEVLKPLVKKYTCYNMAAILMQANNYYKRGQIDEMLATLMPFTWSTHVKPCAPTLEEAIRLVNTPQHIPERMRARCAFLRHALPIRLAVLCPNAVPMDELRRHRDALLQLREMIDNGRINNWYQSHIIELACARANVLLGENDAAIAAAKRCLRDSPNNIAAIAKIYAIAPDELTYHQRELIDSCSKTPLSILAPGLILHGIKIKADQPMKMTSSFEVTFYLECVGYIDSNGKLLVILDDASGTFARQIVPFDAAGSNPMRWRDGELVTIKCTFPMPVVNQIQVHGTPTASNRRVFMSVKAIPAIGKPYKDAPPATFDAYTVEMKP